MFKIYYADRSVIVSQTEGNPMIPSGRIPSMDDPDSPLRHKGVIAIVQDDINVGWTVITGYEYYYYQDGRWYGTDLWGVFDFLEDNKLVTFTRMGARGKGGKILDMAQLKFLARRLDVISGIMVPKSLQEEIFTEIYSDPDLNRLGNWTYPERAITVRSPKGKAYARQKWEV